MQDSAQRSRRMEAQVQACGSFAKDATLFSHDTSAFTHFYVYTRNQDDLEQKWDREGNADASFDNLRRSLAGLPNSGDLQQECAEAARQNKDVCEAVEAQAIALIQQHKDAQARALIESAGKADRDNLEIKLDDLIGINPSQDPNAAPRGLVAYRLRAEHAEHRAMMRTFAVGWTVQGLILILSLVIALLVTRAASQGVQAVLGAQDELRKSESKYRLLFDRNPHPMFVYDRRTLGYLAVNEAAVRHYGYTRDEFLEMTLLDIRPAEDRDHLRRQVETSGPGSAGLDCVWRHLTRDGRLIWVEITSEAVIWAGHDAGMVIAQDITERHRAEEGLNRLAAIVNSSHDAIVARTLDGTVLTWNPGAERLYGWSAEEMIGGKLAPLFTPNLTEERDRINTAIRAGEELEIAETVRLRKDGSLVDISFKSTPLHNTEGVLIGASVLSQDITKQKKAQAMIRWQAYNDSLTGLPNRTRFGEALETAIARSRPCSILFLDLDLFKHVNDSLGHVAGDRLLQEVASRFTRSLTESGGAEDILARMGGDEFTLLILPPDAVPTEGEARAAATVLLEALAEPFLIDGHELHVAASIGISRFPEDGRDAETLLKHADLAMYHAKSEGRGRWQSFTSAMTDSARERLVLENNLRKAIEREEMTVFYQPQVSLRTGEIIGVEALVRWQHPEWGMVSPGRFIPLAEETGLIVPLGEWVLREACRQAALWEREGRPLRVSVNLSARQLSERGLVPSVQSALADAGLDPRWLDLELTESALIANYDRHGETAAGRLTELRVLGVRLSVDDFGTGYSSLSYLRRFPLDTLKVDRSFILGLTGEDAHGFQSNESLQDQAVIQAVIDMAHALSLEVIAEGVERDFQRQTLARLGCDHMQGFLFSPPVPAERLEAFLPAPRTAREAQAA